MMQELFPGWLFFFGFCFSVLAESLQHVLQRLFFVIIPRRHQKSTFSTMRDGLSVMEKYEREIFDMCEAVAYLGGKEGWARTGRKVVESWKNGCMRRFNDNSLSKKLQANYD